MEKVIEITDLKKYYGKARGLKVSVSISIKAKFSVLSVRMGPESQPLSERLWA